MSVARNPNLQLIYVSDVERSTKFYKHVFQAEAVFASPRYVAFKADGEALFAIWSGAGSPEPETPRYSEIGIMLPKNGDVDALFEEWRVDPEIEIVQEPYDEVFGRTFLVKDPDGHVIRVSPVD